jgi:Arc/MetJ-type ribon-helix-helix transcriptional regulator
VETQGVEENKMATVNVDLPDEVNQFVSEKIASGKYESPGEFIVALLAACQHRETIETKLLAAVESNDFQEVTPDLWDRLRKRAAERSRDEQSK